MSTKSMIGSCGGYESTGFLGTLGGQSFQTVRYTGRKWNPKTTFKWQVHTLRTNQFSGVKNFHIRAAAFFLADWRCQSIYLHFLEDSLICRRTIRSLSTLSELGFFFFNLIYFSHTTVTNKKTSKDEKGMTSLFGREKGTYKYAVPSLCLIIWSKKIIDENTKFKYLCGMNKRLHVLCTFCTSCYKKGIKTCSLLFIPQR